MKSLSPLLDVNVSLPGESEFLGLYDFLVQLLL